MLTMSSYLFLAAGNKLLIELSSIQSKIPIGSHAKHLAEKHHQNTPSLCNSLMLFSYHLLPVFILLSEEYNPFPSPQYI